MVCPMTSIYKNMVICYEYSFDTSHFDIVYGFYAMSQLAALNYQTNCFFKMSKQFAPILAKIGKDQ